MDYQIRLSRNYVSVIMTLFLMMSLLSDSSLGNMIWNGNGWSRKYKLKTKFVKKLNF